MPPKRGRGQGGRGRGSPRAKTRAAVSPSKPGLGPANTAAAGGCVEDPLSQEPVYISGDVAEADGSQEAEATTISEAPEVLNEMDTEAKVPMDLEQADDENTAANFSEEPSTSEVADSELAENGNAEQHDESVLSLGADPRESEEKNELSNAGAQVHATLREDVVVINDDDVIIIDDDDQDKDTVAEKLKEADNSLSFWSLRVCPIRFQGIVQNKDNFAKIMAMCLNFEMRMSQHLINEKEEEKMKVDDISGAPWLPKEPLFHKWQAATAGLLEFKLIEKAVPDVIKVISSCEFLRNVRIRFELTKITKEEALKSPFKQEENMNKEAEDKKNEKKKEGELKNILQVNFGKRFPLEPLKQFFWKHPEGHVKQEKDDYLILTNVPNDLPDNILVAIMNTEMKERKLGENNTGTATFKVPKNVVAEEYMARYDGILVNSNMVEMSTILGTLTDWKRLRSEARILRKEEIKKRKLEEKSTVVPAAKRSRWGPQLNASQSPGNPNKQDGRGGQQQGFAGRGQGNTRKPRPGFSLAQQGGGKAGQGRYFQKQQNRQPGGSGNRNPQMARPGNRNQMARPGNRNPQMGRPGSRNPQQLMDMPMQRSPNQSYQSPNNNRDVRRPMMRDNMRPQSLMRISFDVKREPEPDAQIHMMADLQAQLLEKQRELNYLQNQARIQMAMIEQQEMAALHHQRQMQQFSPAGQPSYRDWQPNRQQDRQQYLPQGRNRRR